MKYEFEATTWEYGGQASWFFVTVPKHISEDIKEVSGPYKRGFGSVRVVVTVGASRWQTSVFPDSKTGCYLLPLKKEVRKAENIDATSVFAVRLDIV
jgi:hypothetical protein